jgi:hypothetical protein
VLRVERVFEGSAEDQGVSFALPKFEPGWLGGRSPATRVLHASGTVTHNLPRCNSFLTLFPTWSFSRPPTHPTACFLGRFGPLRPAVFGGGTVHDRVQPARLVANLQSDPDSVRGMCVRWEVVGDRSPRVGARRMTRGSGARSRWAACEWQLEHEPSAAV